MALVSRAGYRYGKPYRYVNSVRDVRTVTYRIFRTENDEVFLKVNLGVGISPQQALATFSTYILQKNVNNSYCSSRKCYVM